MSKTCTNCDFEYSTKECGNCYKLKKLAYKENNEIIKCKNCNNDKIKGLRCNFCTKLRKEKLKGTEKTCRKCNTIYIQNCCPKCNFENTKKRKAFLLENSEEFKHNCIKCGTEKIKGIDCTECRRISSNTRMENEEYKLKKKEYTNTWRSENKQIIKEKRHATYIKNKEKETADNKIWRENNKEKVKQDSKNWIDNNPLRKFMSSRQNIDYTYQELLDKYTNSDGKCYYCRITLETKSSLGTLSKISLDRKDSNIHYTLDNIEFCCYFCNMAKNSCNIIHYREFIKAIKGNSEYQEIYKNEINTRWTETLLSHCQNKGEPLTPEWCRNQFKIQNGKCFYSDIKLIKSKMPYFPFKPSIERLDSSKPHTPDNCVLVCLAINLGKNSKTVEELLDYLKLISTEN